MNIVSVEFLLFVICVTILYFAVPKKSQWIVMLVSNLVFYSYAGICYIGYMLFISLVTFIAAWRLEKVTNTCKKAIKEAKTPDEKKTIKAYILKKKKAMSGVAIILSMGIWGVLKYTNFFVENINSLVGMFNTTASISMAHWALPLGISFYTFHAVGYMVDVYRGKYDAEHNFLKYFTFISFFPHIIQGPFSRYDDLGKSMREEHSFSYDRLCSGCARMLWGYYKKIVVADKIGIAATTIFTNSATYSGCYMMFAICAYGIQLYADFSGYMDIVCGFSSILGIELPENFLRPYFAKTVDEFWRRWHITLGTWFRDYVFYPVSMGKTGQRMGKWARGKWGAKMGKLVPGYFALIFVWTATGLWHGANWTYLVWGYLNLLVITLSMQLSDLYERVKTILKIKSDHILWKIFCIIRTFALVCFFRFFSAAPDIRTANEMLRNTFGDFHLEALKSPTLLFVGIDYIDIFFILAGSTAIFLVDLLGEINLWNKVKIKCPMIIRNVVYVAMLVLIMFCIGSSSELMGGFMYASF